MTGYAFNRCESYIPIVQWICLGENLSSILADRRHLLLLHRICVSQAAKFLCKSMHMQNAKFLCKSMHMQKTFSKRQIVSLFTMSRSLKGYNIFRITGKEEMVWHRAELELLMLQMRWG